MRGDRDFLYPAVSAADATWRQVGNWRTEAALLARGVSAAPILAGIASAVHSLSASLTTRIELFRDVIQLGSIAVDTIKEELSPLFEAFRHWTQLVRRPPLSPAGVGRRRHPLLPLAAARRRPQPPASRVSRPGPPARPRT